jgi:hypothetical protein
MHPMDGALVAFGSLWPILGNLTRIEQLVVK